MSLYDPLYSFRSKLEGRAELLCVDRLGHWWSDIGGSEYILPDAHADAIARLMKLRGIPGAIIVGHSFRGAITEELAVRHPDMVSGLVFLSPVLYCWKGEVAWSYDAASKPVTGSLFSALLAPTVGLFAIGCATRDVFAPNPKPADHISRTNATQAVRPSAFRRNAPEISALNDWGNEAFAGYGKIRAPTVIITGDADKIVSPDAHARHLARDIGGARLIVVHNLGHNPTSLPMILLQPQSSASRDRKSISTQLPETSSDG
ncbi:alpha/beta fold hydrolase [Rhizobium rhizogenes]|uniref:alpha/beta fold hydrolase n=1 Tax=Rhizobium rhizogenes TaxID=359 RepID=UPI001F3050EB|nr:alpha/beta hydrolase [Rhizobium rhizogenes]